MNFAIDLAKKGIGFVNPNPLVGCVIVKNNKVISTGYHKKYGENHAERDAILNAKEDLTGATLYVNLEPCCHYGKTPPCTDIIIQSGIKNVVIGCLDNNSIVSGKGIKILQDNNINVITGVLEKECKTLNEIFFHYIINKTPFIIMKYAMTLDGKIATSTGNSKWVTNEDARLNVHKTRSLVSGILVGINTVLKDNPTLDLRYNIKGNNPIRIICDTNLKIPIDSNIVKTAKNIQTYIACSLSSPKDKITKLERLGVKIILCPLENNRIDLNFLIKTLGKLNIDSILLEGGGTLNFSFLEKNLVNKIQCYLSPKIFGGEYAKTPVENIGVKNVEDAFKFSLCNIKHFAQDLLLEYIKI